MENVRIAQAMFRKCEWVAKMGLLRNLSVSLKIIPASQLSTYTLTRS